MPFLINATVPPMMHNAAKPKEGCAAPVIGVLNSFIIMIFLKGRGNKKYTRPNFL